MLTVVRGDGPYAAMLGAIDLLSSHASADPGSGRLGLTDVSVAISNARPDNWPGSPGPDTAFAELADTVRRYSGDGRLICGASVGDTWFSVRLGAAGVGVTAVTTEADVVGGIDALCRRAGDLYRTAVSAAQPAPAIDVNLHFSCLWLEGGQRAEALRRARLWHHPGDEGSRADGVHHAQR